MKKWKEFLTAHTSPATPAYAEAEKWKAEGWTWERVVAEWHKGEDILWAALWLGLITEDEARKLACACVDRCACLAPDVVAVSDAVKRGDMALARHEIMAAEAITFVKEPELPDPKKPEVIPVAETTEIHGASKARYAASLLPVDKAWMAMSHSVQAKVHEARGAWTEALREAAISEGIEPDKDGNIYINDKKMSPITKAMIQELAAAIPRVEASEHKAHADIVREYFGGLK